MNSHVLTKPSPWVERFASKIATGGTVLDLACGHGRHARYLADLGYQVEALDRDADALATLADVPNIVPREVDVEGGAWPYYGRAFNAIIVTNYLHRPLLPLLINALDEGGVLIYETFMQGNERFGKPNNPLFLLRPGELLEVMRRRLQVIAFEQGEIATPKPAMVQRLCATRGATLRID
ncbi:MAG TPA: methyltransferase domain-containing protein [Rhodocyclaceae bacterium]|jgi:SAM-dependent methyltransferase|nr:methyltransferase domain-containing protein [Rhodocyclaceae bacterium]